jgi:hypothetical protein
MRIHRMVRPMRKFLVVLLSTFALAAPAAANPPLPNPPAAYSLPATYQTASSVSQLTGYLTNGNVNNIVVEDGTYDVGDVTFAQGDRVYARNLHGATITGTLTIDAPGAILQGLDFDSGEVDTDKVNGTGVRLRDLTFEGNYAMDRAIDDHGVSGDIIQRIVAKHYRLEGIRVSTCCDDPQDPSTWYDDTQTATTVQDLDVDGVHINTTPDTSPCPPDGTGVHCGIHEYGITIGNQVTNCVCRLQAVHAWWSDLKTTDSSHDNLYRYLTLTDVDRSGGSALYNEHMTVRDEFKNYKFGPGISEGNTCEWDNDVAGFGACQDATFTDGSINSTLAGLVFDHGSVATVTGAIFHNQSCAAIENIDGESTITQSGNDFSDIDSGAVDVKTSGRC